jgi:hypothetical protein
MTTTAKPQSTLFDLHFEQAVKISRTREPAEIERDLIHARQTKDRIIAGTIEQVKEAVKKNPTMTKLPDLLRASQSITAAHVAGKYREKYTEVCKRIAGLKDELAAAKAVRK